MSKTEKGFSVEPGGGEEVDHIRYCPSCGRIGNMTICGPHVANGLPLASHTIPHPDPALQTAFRMGGLQAAAEYAKELTIDTPRDFTAVPEEVLQTMSAIISLGQKGKKK